MPTPSVISGEVLEPVLPERPAGDDLSGTPLWVQIRAARPNLEAGEDHGQWARAETPNSGWPLVIQMTSSALATRSKDLRLAIWFTEAAAAEHGFAGVRDGLRVVRELLTRFWDSGLYPLIEDGDLENRSGPLEWLNEKLAEAIRNIPLTMRPSPAPNYSYNFYVEALRPSGGAITKVEFDTAVQAAKRAPYEILYADFLEARQELDAFDLAAKEKFGDEALAFPEAKEAFGQCKAVLDGILRKKRAEEPDPSDEPGGETSGNAEARPDSLELAMGGMDRNDLTGAWAEAEKQARAGNVDSALAQMTKLAAAEPNGRVRFHRKLLLADICMKTGRHKLAKSILEELSQQIDTHHLDQWETAEPIGAVWTRLYRCYRNEQAGTADPDKAAVLFERLCRLDPWQALACSDGK